MRVGVTRLAAITAAAFTALLLFAPFARAQGAGWVIESFDVAVTVHPDGTLDVVEDIAVDFGALTRRGIFRVIPARYDLPATDTRIDLPEGRTPSDYVRAIDITDIAVSSPTAPDDLDISRPDNFGNRLLTLRIGDPDTTITGRHQYRISYSVRGALNQFEGHAELYWNATGTEWEAPIASATTVVAAPEIGEVTCFRGSVGATNLCDEADAAGDSATFSASDLQPGEGLTVVAAFPLEAVDVPPPILIERWTPARAFAGAPFAVPLAGVLAVAGLGGVGALAYRQGRDRVTRGPVSVHGAVEGDVTRRSLFAPRVTPVEFRPPDDLRPAQVGLIVDERVDPVDVSATIVDLAVRGHLTITEVESKKSWFGKTDWTLQRLEPPDDELLPYEQRLLDGLFDSRKKVRVSTLKGKFASDYKAVKDMIYADGKRQGWFTRRPDRVRGLWLGIGILLIVLGIAGLVVGFLLSNFAVVALPVLVTGIVLTVAHRWLPHRTARGSRVLDRTLGFRQFITTAEAERAEFAEKERMFVSFLPYAVVFGAVDHWAETFARLGVDPGTAVGYWYVGMYPGHFDFHNFSSGLSDFSSSVGKSLPTAPPSSGGSSGFSSGGGFSGGGFGGGGGGSW